VTGFQPLSGFRTSWLYPDRSGGDRDRDDLHFSGDYPRRDGQKGTARVRTHCDRVGSDVCSPDQYSANNTSVNPARTTGVAIFQGDWALSQLWLFWLAPIVGAVLAGFAYRWLGSEDRN